MRKIVLASVLSVTCSAVSAASLEKAELLSEHGLVKEAKTELIDVIFSNSQSKTKSAAYYRLGSIAFEQNQISPALKTWTELVEKYPKSKEAALVKSRLIQLSEIAGESAKETVENAVAASYLNHADFWSSDKSNRFSIDSSWIPKVEAAVKWYDKIITEFPGTKAARIAHEDKLKTLFGWEERGKYGSSYGLEANFNGYMPKVLDTFQSLEKNFPKASTLQAFRYQIAQAYWGEKDWDNTRKWLQVIIDQPGDDSFYKDTAQRRLKKIEY